MSPRPPVTPRFRISVLNTHFYSSDEHEYADRKVARQHAMRGALAIGIDEIVGGKEFFVAEVTLDEDEQRIERFVVSVGAMPLKI